MWSGDILFVGIKVKSRITLPEDIKSDTQGLSFRTAESVQLTIRQYNEI